jgi:hypothetical protein
LRTTPGGGLARYLLAPAARLAGGTGREAQALLVLRDTEILTVAHTLAGRSRSARLSAACVAD